MCECKQCGGWGMLGMDDNDCAITCQPCNGSGRADGDHAPRIAAAQELEARLRNRQLASGYRLGPGGGAEL